MPEIEVTSFGLAELANRTHNGVTIDLANELTKKIPMLRDAPFKEANDIFSHREGKVKQLPTVTVRGLNEGVAPSAALSRPMVWEMTVIEDLSEIDELALDGVKNKAGQRSQEDVLHLEAVSQEFGRQFWYGDHDADIKELNGLSKLFCNYTADANVATCGGAGNDVTSLWFIQWGFDGTFLVYPRGHANVGVEQIDKGLERVEGPDAGTFLYKWVTQTRFRWGLVVKDDRCAQRICNIESTGAANLLDEDLMIAAYNRLPDPTRAVAYCNGTAKTQLDIIAKDRPSLVHTEKDPFGRPVTYFWDVPIRKSDSLLNTETDVVA